MPRTWNWWMTAESSSNKGLQGAKKSSKEAVKHAWLWKMPRQHCPLLLVDKLSVASGQCGIRQSYSELRECISPETTLIEDLLCVRYWAYNNEQNTVCPFKSSNLGLGGPSHTMPFKWRDSSTEKFGAADSALLEIFNMRSLIKVTKKSPKRENLLNWG